MTITTNEVKRYLIRTVCIYFLLALAYYIKLGYAVSGQEQVSCVIVSMLLSGLDSWFKRYTETCKRKREYEEQSKILVETIRNEGLKDQVEPLTTKSEKVCNCKCQCDEKDR